VFVVLVIGLASGTSSSSGISIVVGLMGCALGWGWVCACSHFCVSVKFGKVVRASGAAL
jgi:hypothetical protein